jgi:paired amphipathic helix protein Sin3a
MQQQGPAQQVAAPVFPPPSYHQSTPSGGHSLPTLADLTGGASSGHHQPSPYNTHPPPPAPSHSLPGLGQSIPHQSTQSFMNRDRETHIQEIREREMRERELQRQLDQEHREREARDRHERDREHMERMHREQQQQQQQQQHHAQQQHPVQSHTGSIPIHQPVASKVPSSIHGPNGLLSNIGSGQGSQASNAQGGNSGGSSIFGMSAQPAANPPRQSTFLHQPVGPPQPQPGPGFMGPGPVPGPGPSPMPGQATLGQGQQPILNVSVLAISLSVSHA